MGNGSWAHPELRSQGRVCQVEKEAVVVVDVVTHRMLTFLWEVWPLWDWIPCSLPRAGSWNSLLSVHSD